MHNLTILDDLSFTLCAFNRTTGSRGMPCSIKACWENTNLCKRPEQKLYMKECFKIALKWDIKNVCPLCEDEFCCSTAVLPLNFGYCSPLGSDNGTKIVHLLNQFL